MTPGDLNGLAVLAVEDNRVMRSILVRALETLGARDVREAGDGSEALAVLESFAPDLIVTDWNMKPMDGVELVRRVRRGHGERRRDVPVIVITAHAEPWRTEAARDAGANAILFKPLTAEAFRQCALEVLTAPPPFVEAPAYVGPDRRRNAGAYTGPERRRPGR